VLSTKLPFFKPVKHPSWISTNSHFRVHLVATHSKTNLSQYFQFVLTDYLKSIILIYNMSTFLFYPPGITVKVIGTDCGTCGRSCYVQHICGSLLTVDVVVHLQRLQILDNGKERLVIAAYHVSDGIDSCCVGFLKRELTKFSSLYKGVLVQVGSSTRQLCCCHHLLFA